MAQLLSSSARTESGVSEPLGFGNSPSAASLQLNVTATATDVLDTLDVYVQHSVDGGDTWTDFVHFSQVVGNTGARRFSASWVEPSTPESSEEMVIAPDAAMSAGVRQVPVGPVWRVKWVVVDSGTDNASFTFSVHATVDVPDDALERVN